MGKKDTDMDDMDSWDDFDSDDFDFDGGFGKNARSPAKSPASYGIRFAKKMPGSFGKQVLNKISDEMPNTSSMVSDAFDVKDAVMDLKDEALEQVGMLANEAKSALKPFLPFTKKLLPKSFYDKADKFLTVEKASRYNAEKEKELRRHSEMGEAINSIFAQQAQAKQAEMQEGRANKAIEFLRGEKQHRESLGSTQEIKHELQVQNAFMSSAVMAYMKKSLEIKFKNFFVAQDLLEVTKVQAKLFETELPKVVKNTSLPDIQKTLNTELLWNRSKEKLLATAQDKMRDFALKGVDKIKKKMFGNIGSIRDILQQAGSMGDMLDEDMMDSDAFDVIGMGVDQGSSLLTKTMSTPMAKTLLKIFKTEMMDIEEGSANWQRRVYARLKTLKDKYSNDPSFLKSMGGQFLGNFVEEVDTKVSYDKSDLSKNPYKPTSFDISSRHALVEVIPGYLSKQLKYIMDIANGQDNEELFYDNKLGNFDKASAVFGRAKKEIFKNTTDSSKTAIAIGKMRGRYMISDKDGLDPAAFDKQSDSIRQMMNNRVKYNQEFLPNEFLDYVKKPEKMTPYIKKIMEGIADPVGAAHVISTIVAPDGKIDKKAVSGMNNWFYEGTSQAYLNKLRQGLEVPGMGRLMDDNGLFVDREKDVSSINQAWIEKSLQENKLSKDKDKRAQLYGQSSFFRDSIEYEDARLGKGMMEDTNTYKAYKEAKRIYDKLKKKDFNLAEREDPNAHASMERFADLVTALKQGNLKNLSQERLTDTERELSIVEGRITEKNNKELDEHKVLPLARKRGAAGKRRTGSASSTSSTSSTVSETFSDLLNVETSSNAVLIEIKDYIKKDRSGGTDNTPTDSNKELIENLRDTLGIHTAKSAEDRANMISLLHEISLFNYHQGDRFAAPGFIKRSAKRLLTLPFTMAGLGLKAGGWVARTLGPTAIKAFKLPFTAGIELLKRTGPLFNASINGVKGMARGAGWAWENMGKPLVGLMGTAFGGLMGYAKDKLPGFAKGVFDFAKMPFKKTWDTAKWAKGKLGGVYSKGKEKLFGKTFVDIYRADRKDKVLLSASRQEEGVMYQDGAKVKSSREINQPVFALDDEQRHNPLITEDDLKVGLVGPDGKPIGILNKGKSKLKGIKDGIVGMAKKIGFDTPINKFLFGGFKKIGDLLGGIGNPLTSTVPNYQGRVLTRLNMLISLNGGTPPDDGPLVGTSLVGKIGSGIAAGGKNLLKAGSWLKDKFKGAGGIKGIGSAIGGGIGGLKDLLAGSSIGGVLGGMGSRIKGMFTGAGTGIKNAGKDVSSAFTKASGKAKKFVPKTAEQALGLMSAKMTALTDFFTRKGKSKYGPQQTAGGEQGLSFSDLLMSGGIIEAGKTALKGAIITALPWVAGSVVAAGVGVGTGMAINYVNKQIMGGAQDAGLKLLAARKAKYGVLTNGKVDPVADFFAGSTKDWVTDIESKVVGDLEDGMPVSMHDSIKLVFMDRLGWDLKDKEAKERFLTWFSARFIPTFQAYLSILKAAKVSYRDANLNIKPEQAEEILKAVNAIKVKYPTLVLEDYANLKFKKNKKTWIDPVTGEVHKGEKPDDAILDSRREEMEAKKAKEMGAETKPWYLKSPISWMKDSFKARDAQKALDDIEYDPMFKFTGSEAELMEKTKAWIKGYEGLRLKAYNDSYGNNTIGYGHLNVEGYTEITKAQADKIFEMDMDKHLSEAMKIPEWGNLDPVRRMALLNMVFNMGKGGVMNFKTMREALAAGKYPEAASAALDSEYGRAKETSKRAQEVAAVLKSGDPNLIKPKAVGTTKDDRAKMSQGDLDTLSNSKYAATPGSPSQAGEAFSKGLSDGLANVGPQPSGEGDTWKKSDPKVNMDGVHPTVRNNFEAMASEYKDETGKPITVNSGFRDPALQAALYAKNPAKAAPPGKSFHNKGLAIDINSADANKLDSTGLMDKYSFDRPLMGMKEPWHIEPDGIRSGKAQLPDSQNMGSPSLRTMKPVDYSANGPGQSLRQKDKDEQLLSNSNTSATLNSPTEVKVEVNNKDVVDETAKTNELLAKLLVLVDKQGMGATKYDPKKIQEQYAAEMAKTQKPIQGRTQAAVSRVEPVVSSRRAS